MRHMREPVVRPAGASERHTVPQYRHRTYRADYRIIHVFDVPSARERPAPHTVQTTIHVFDVPSV